MKIFTNQIPKPLRYFYVNHRLRKVWSTTKINPNAQRISQDEAANFVQLRQYTETYYA